MKFGHILMSLLLALMSQLGNAADNTVPSTLRIGTSAELSTLDLQAGRSSCRVWKSTWPGLSVKT